ncbi:MAG: hypothetical protein GYA02_07700 [Clostridiaceae bacterium]|jgi:flagellar protein FlgJ|nr:hypothetical protein [Clostridiaceae bacterium]
MSITGAGLGSGLSSYYDILKYQSTGTPNSQRNTTGDQKGSSMLSAESLSDDNGFQAKLKHAMEQKDEKALREVCQSMEEIFLNMMYKQMRATVHKSDLIPESISTDIIQSMYDEALIKETTKSRSIGIADMLYKQLYNEMNNVYKKEVTEE